MADSTSYIIGIKKSSTAIDFYKVVNAKVKDISYVTISAGNTPTCDCQMAKFGDGDCVHKVLAEKDVKYWFNGAGTGVPNDPRNFYEAKQTLYWKDEEADSRYVLVHDPTLKVTGIVDPKVGDFPLAVLLGYNSSEYMPDVCHKLVDYVQPDRLTKELLVSDDKDLRLSDPTLINKVASPKTYDVIPPWDIPSPHDDSLTEGDFLHSNSPDKKVTAKTYKLLRKVKRPRDDQFFVDPEVWEQGVRGLTKGKNICITGPSGCGKTELIHLLSKATKLDIESINMGATSEPREVLVGTVEYSPDRGTYLQRSRFSKFVGNDKGVVLLDEITRGSRDANNILLPLMDRQAYLALDEEEGGTVIRRGAGMAFAATANVGMEYTGTEALDIALKQRFQVTIDMYFPEIKNEIEVLKGRTGIDYPKAKAICEVAEQQRTAKRDGDFVEEISTRMLLEAAELMVDGFDLITSCKYAILNIFSNEGEESSERSRVLQMIQKRGK